MSHIIGILLIGMIIGAGLTLLIVLALNDPSPVPKHNREKMFDWVE